MKRPCALTWLLLCCVLGPLAEAHSGASSYVEVDRSRAPTEVRLLVDVALPDLAGELPLDRDGDGQLRWSEVIAAAADINLLLTRRLQVLAGQAACRADTFERPQVADRETGRHLRWVATYRCPSSGGDLALDVAPWLNEMPLQGVYVSDRDAPRRVVLLTGTTTRTSLQPGSGSPLAFFALGIEHLLTGYDHLAFLALLLLGTLRSQSAARSPRRLVQHCAQVVTAFTLAHSLTLALAATDVLRLPAAPVEAAIAASILLTAVAVLRGGGDWSGWPLALGFGLVHGLGFANVLAELLSGRALLAPLLSFNLGLEAAQLGLVIIALPLLWALSRRPMLARWFVPGAATSLGTLAAFWLVQRWP